jgi:phosphoribosylglycinamide formyltransferase 1
MNRIVIFASGTGTNALAIINHFNGHQNIEVVAVLCNRKEAGVLDKAASRGLQTFLFSKDDLYNNGRVKHILKTVEADWIILAGFLWLMPSDIITTFKDRIINIHPALLPKFGGKGMFGIHVHQAVIDAGEKESGITIHQINEEYDTGAILFQARIFVKPNETAESLAARIHLLEHAYFPKVIENFIRSSN